MKKEIERLRNQINASQAQTSAIMGSPELIRKHTS